MALLEACSLFSALTGLPAALLREEGELEQICLRARFHRTPSALSAKAVKEALSSLEDLQTISLSDHLQIHLLAGKLRGQIIVVGPFCCEALSTMDAHALLKRGGLPPSWTQDLLAFTSSLPLLPEKEAVKLLRNLIAHEEKASLLPETIYASEHSPIIPEGEEFLEKSFEALVEERYANESQLMQAIREGNASQAVNSWRRLHQRVEFMRERVGHTKDSYMHSASITRTVVRLAAMEAGVAPIILDGITSEISERNRQSKNVDEILANTELLIRRICGEVQRLGRESSLVSKVKDLIHRHYMEDLTIEEISKYLGLPESRLIEKYRRETGSTPGQYLRKVRLSKAKQELMFTGKSIQEISAQVGIGDAGYFTRLFRAEYGMTPRGFRSRGIEAGGETGIEAGTGETEGGTETETEGGT